MKFWSKFLPALWAVIVFALHLVKVDIDPEREKLIPHADKLVHYGMFAVLAFLLVRSWKFHNSNVKIKSLVFIVIICLLYGGLMEYLQSLSNGRRDGDVLDWFADVAGSISGVLFARTTCLSLFFSHKIRKPA